MLNDIPQVNLVAAIGPGGSLGPKEGLPIFKDRDEARIYEEWFADTIAGGIVIMDDHTVRLMAQNGYTGPDGYDLVVWEGQPPEALLPAVQATGKPIFVVGSADLYRAFMPWVKQFLVRRVEMVGPHETFMPNPFGTMN